MTKTTVLQPLCQLQALPLDEIIFSKSLQQTGASLKKIREQTEWNSSQIQSSSPRNYMVAHQVPI